MKQYKVSVPTKYGLVKIIINACDAGTARAIAEEIEEDMQ